MSAIIFKTPEDEVKRLETMKNFYVFTARKTVRETANLAESLASVMERAEIARSIDYLISQIKDGIGGDQ